MSENARNLLTKEDMKNKLAETLGTTKKDAAAIYDAFCSIAADHLANGGEVKIAGVGKIYRATLEATTARNPQNGTEVQVPKRFRYKLSARPFLAE